MGRYVHPMREVPRYSHTDADGEAIACGAIAHSIRELVAACRNASPETRQVLRETINILRADLRRVMRAEVSEGYDDISIANHLHIPDRLRGVIKEWGAYDTCPDCGGAGMVIDERETGRSGTERGCYRCLGSGEVTRTWRRR